MRILREEEITIPEVRKILEEKAETLDIYQRRVLDYAIKFSKLEPEQARKMRVELENLGLDRSVATQIVNTMPTTADEVRMIIGRQKILPKKMITDILEVIRKYSGK